MIYLPSFYFILTRLRTLKSISFQLFFEWIPSFTLLIYFKGIDVSILNYVLCYIAFISIYEIGYFSNDHVFSKKEKSPRSRIQGKNLHFSLFIIIRILFFFFITVGLGYLLEVRWWSFFLCLSLAFYLHNRLNDYDYRVATFFALASLRFFAPVFMLLGSDQIEYILPAVIFNYVFFRTLSYMDSKGLLSMARRTTHIFRKIYFGIGLIITATFSIILNNPLSFFIGLYYLSVILLMELLDKLAFSHD